MAFVRLEPKYELLDGKRKYVQPIVHTMVLIGLAVLVIFVVILMFYVSWMKFDDSNNYQNIPMDYVLFGPQKYTISDAVSYRSHTFAVAAKSNYKTKNWTAKYNVNLEKRINKLYNLACYYSLPTQNSSDHLLPSQINATLCTHLIVTFAQVKDNSVYLSLNDSKILQQVVKLRKQNLNLKVLLSILHLSNGSHSNEGFPGVVADKENLNKFVNSVVSVVRKFYLDGIDIDWEFPSWPLLNLEEKYGYAKLLETLHNQLPDSLLTAAVAAPLNIIDSAYEIYALASFVDFINVMAYDYHSYQWYFPITGPNSPLFSSKSDTGFLQNLNINTSIQYWISKGMPKEKILLGMPTYGHSFKLINEANHGFNSPADGPGIGKGGFVTFSETCNFISQHKAPVIFDHDTRTPYSYYQTNWISYDDERSLAYKAEFVASLGLGGAMVFSLNTDDYKGLNLCTASIFPLTSRIKLVLNDDYL